MKFFSMKNCARLMILLNGGSRVTRNMINCNDSSVTKDRDKL